MDYRKDASPQETIKRITKILKSLNIEYVITNEKSYKNYWWSLRVEMRDRPSISTNGKGCTRLLALASGLAEFMERLQAGMLLDSFKTQDQTEYYNILTHNNCSFSNELLKTMCGTNGLASGNTIHESICQAFFENLERYVVKRLFLNPETESFGIFNKKLFTENDAYEKIVEIEKNGLLTYVVDGTCGGKFPVLGLIVFNPKSHSYLINLASDFDINICLNRCITELFQGRTIKYLVNGDPSYLNSVFNKAELDEKIEFYKQITISHGSLPDDILYRILSNVSNDCNLNVFAETRTSDECYRMIESFCKQKKMDVYIGDLSCTDFCTCRVYIPGYSEVYEDDIEIACKMRNCIAKLKRAIAQYARKESKINVLIKALIDLLPYNVYSFHLPFYRLIPHNITLHPELFSDDIMHILSILCLYQRNIDDAIIYARKSLGIYNKSHIQFLLWYLHIKKNNSDCSINFWYDESDGINQCIDVFERIYNNSVELFYDEI